MRRFLTAREQVEMLAPWNHHVAMSHDGVFWHGTPSGDLRGSGYGLHVGTYEAAREALEARIGRRADGKPWDGTQAYGETLLDMDQHRHRFNPEDRSWVHEVTRRPPAPPNGRATYGDGSSISMDAKPDIFPVRISGPMSNTPDTPHPDFKANGYMRAQISRGSAKRGYYYTNEGEGVTVDPLTGNIKHSISAVVPHGGHLEMLDRSQHPFPEGDFTPKWSTGYSVTSARRVMSAVTLFTKPGCFGCKGTARELDKHGIPYEARDVTQDPEAYAQVQQLGYSQLPVVHAGGDNHWSGHRPDRIRTLVT